MSVLKEHGSGFGVDVIEPALAGSEEELKAFLVSNTLWGGAGSIADQAGGDRAARRVIESALIELGQEQIRVGTINARTHMWVDAFQQWRASGI